MRAYTRDLEILQNGLPLRQRRQARNVIKHVGKHRYVMPLILRRIDDQRNTEFGCRIAPFEGQQCVHVAIIGVCLVFRLCDVRLDVLIHLRRRMYTWSANDLLG